MEHVDEENCGRITCKDGLFALFKVATVVVPASLGGAFKSGLLYGVAVCFCCIWTCESSCRKEQEVPADDIVLGELPAPEHDSDSSDDDRLEGQELPHRNRRPSP